MKTHLKLFAGVALLAVSSASAQNDATKPVGFNTSTLQGGGVFNLLSAELTEPVSAAGTWTAVTGTTSSDDAADFSTSLAAPDTTWICQITSGNAAGIVTEIASVDSATSVTTADDLQAAGVAAGDAYEIRAAKTISDFFGPNNEAGLLGGDAGSTDEIWLPDGAGGFDIYFYQDNFLGQQWISLGGQDGTNTPIVYTDAFFVKRVAADPLDIVQTGHVQTRAATVPLIQGFNFVSRIGPVGQTLTTSGLKDSVKGGEVADADRIWITNAAGTGFDIYYYQDNFLGQQWVSLAGADGTNVELSPGVIIERKDVATNATVGLPDFYAEL